MSTAAEPVAAKKKASSRDYVVLRKDGRGFEFVANVNASNVNQAIEKAVGRIDAWPDGPLELVATPARSFKPVPVAIETKTVTKIKIAS